MNLPVEWSDDKVLTLADFEPGRIVSLWDMLRLNADAFVNTCTIIAGVAGIVSAVKSAATAQKNIPTQALNECGIPKLRGALVAMGLTISVATADDIVALMKDKNVVPVDDLDRLLMELLRIFPRELKGQHFMMIAASRAQYYACKGTFLGQDVLDNLPLLREDAEEAGNCFALGRYTACVFHLMRIMERLVQEFASRVGLIIDVKNEIWDTILKKVKSVTEPKPNHSRKLDEEEKRINKETRKIYQRFYDRLDAVRDACRNETMHPKATYSEEQADDVMRAVKAFVKNFVTMIPPSSL